MVLVIVHRIFLPRRVIYSPTDELVSMHGVCLGQTTNNIAEYSEFIELLFDSMEFGMLSLRKSVKLFDMVIEFICHKLV